MSQTKIFKITVEDHLEKLNENTVLALGEYFTDAKIEEMKTLEIKEEIQLVSKTFRINVNENELENLNLSTMYTALHGYFSSISIQEIVEKMEVTVNLGNLRSIIEGIMKDLINNRLVPNINGR